MWPFECILSLVKEPFSCYDRERNQDSVNTMIFLNLLIIFFIFCQRIWRLGSDERHPTFQKYRDLFQKYQVHVRRMFDEFHIRPSDELNHFQRKCISSNVWLILHFELEIFLEISKKNVIWAWKITDIKGKIKRWSSANLFTLKRLKIFMGRLKKLLLEVCFHVTIRF